MNNRKGLGEVIVGLGMVVAGVLFLLSTFDIFQGVEWWRWLPVLLVLWAVVQFINSRGQDIFGPLLLGLVGLALLLATLDVIDWADFGRLWPVVLIVIGGSILWGRRRAGRAGSGGSPDQIVDVVSVLGENTKRPTSQQFKGGDVSAVMGSAKVDLRDARLADGASISVTVVMAGVEILVPDDWEVDVAASVILGGVEDKRRIRVAPADAANALPQRLRITGLVLMGGLEVKS
ncbi:MAG: DUF5668 domain-containing protein [Dehalococcoidia bacterium]